MKKILKNLCLVLVILAIPFLSACTNDKIVVNILKTSTNGNVDTYTIYYSDNSTSTFEVNNGQKTIINIEKTSTTGKIDTYTIYYSDNSTSTFEVTNGNDGIDGMNGKDGTVITVNDLYEEWKKTLTNGEDSSFDAFLEKYLIVDKKEENVVNVAKALNSVVSINCVFNYSYSSIFGSSTDQSASAGSGVIIQMSEEDKANGNCLIVTNYHVVYDADSSDSKGISQDIRVYLYGLENSSRNKIEAKYIGGSMAHDIAVLKVTGSEILKNSNAVQCEISPNSVVVGQEVFAIGNPEGDGISVTKGICSVESEQIDMTLSDNLTEGTFRVIRIDAPVNPGNSGGGLFDSNGQLIGIVNAKLIDDTIDCIGYAISKEVSLAVVDKIVKTCDGQNNLTPKFAKLGLSCIAYSYETYYDYDTCSIKIREHIVVSEVAKGGIAETLGENGFKSKDLIVSAKYNGKEYKFEKMDDLSNFLLLLDENAVIDIMVKRVIIPENNVEGSDNYIDLTDDNLIYNTEYEDVAIRLTYSPQYMK